MAQERQDHQRDSNQRPHGCSSSSQKMQYAVQIDGIWRDLLQNLEKTRDAMSSSSVQVDGEMSPEFARLDTCDRHMTRKWRGTALLGGVPCSGQRGNAGSSGIQPAVLSQGGYFRKAWLSFVNR